jgi:hypothetical protein
MIAKLYRSALLPFLMLLAALLPLWLGRYPPLYDYPLHLLEAQVLLRYNDPLFHYAAGYRLNEGWPFNSNALSTLLIAGLGYLLPIELAGRLALSLYLVLFVSGMWLLLRRVNAVWPLLLLAPMLAWNLAFSSGWLNFCYGLALGLHMLALFFSWSEAVGRWKYLVMLALLSAAIAMAHAMAWALWAIVIVTIAASGGLPPRRGPWLVAALSLPVLPALAASPLLALAWAALPIATWFAGWLFQRLGLLPGRLVLIAPFVALACYALGSVFDSRLVQLDPVLTYNRFARTSFLFRSFTLPQQAYPLNEFIAITNLSALMLLGALVVLLMLDFFQRNRWHEPWLAALAALIALYGLVPSGSSVIEIVEPRVVIVAVLLGLFSIGLPATPGLRPFATALSSLICVFSFVSAVNYSLSYNRQATQWQQNLALLGDARRVLAIHTASPTSYGPTTPLNRFTSLYDGVFFSSYWFVQHGGYTTRMFGNGPVWLHDHIPGWLYYFPQPEGAIGHAEEQCALAKTNFDAILAWGPLEREIHDMLVACLGQPRTQGAVTVWGIENRK